MGRILALDFVELAIANLRRVRPDTAPIALLLGSRGAGRVVAECSAAAAALGVERGMGEAQARARIGARRATFETWDGEGVRAVLGELALRALAFSPRVALDPPTGLLLDLGGMQRLCGGERQHVARITGELAALGFPVRAAVADTAGCAGARARYAAHGNDFVPSGAESAALAGLPVEALRPEPEVLAALGEIGIERIGDLLCLPRRSLAARFGAELGRSLDRALGGAFEPLSWLRPPKPEREVRSFESPVGLEVVQAVLRELVNERSAAIRRRGEGALRIELELECAGSPPVRETIVLGRPTHEAACLATLFDLRLARAQLGFGVTQLRLELCALCALPEIQTDAFEPTLASQQRRTASEELIATLTERLGRGRVLGVQPVETHVPEAAFRCSPASLPRRKETSAAVTPCPRPSAVYARPWPVHVTGRAGPQPRVLSWRGEELEIVHLAGPERIEPPWWKGAPAGARDLYRAEVQDGRWLWLERDAATEQWSIRGEWA